MNDERNRLMLWQPGVAGFSRDDIILAIGLQCRTKHFLLPDVLAWLGIPDKAIGDSTNGHLVYFYSGDAEVTPIFDVRDGRIVEFGTITRHSDNAKRVDPKTGKETFFNFLNEMGPFDGAKFR